MGAAYQSMEGKVRTAGATSAGICCGMYGYLRWPRAGSGTGCDYSSTIGCDGAFLVLVPDLSYQLVTQPPVHVAASDVAGYSCATGAVEYSQRPRRSDDSRVLWVPKRAAVLQNSVVCQTIRAGVLLFVPLYSIVR